MFIITGSGKILSSSLILEDDEDIPGIRMEVRGRTDVEDPSTEFHAFVDALIDGGKARGWQRLIESNVEAGRDTYCHFSGFAMVLPSTDVSQPRYHIRSFFVAPDISAIEI